MENIFSRFIQWSWVTQNWNIGGRGLKKRRGSKQRGGLKKESLRGGLKAPLSL